jgi:thiamine kinase
LPDAREHRPECAALQGLDRDFDLRFFQSLRARGLDVAAPLPLQGGRSNRVWHCGDLVIKLYLPAGHTPLFANDPALEASALASLAGTGMVPVLRSSGLFEGQSWLAYGHITGAPWQRDTAHVAQLLGRLHDQPAFSGVPRGVNGSAALERQTRAILAKCRQQTADVAQVTALRPFGQVPPLQQLALIHGDPVPGNLLAHDGTLTLIDWQCPQLGDPSEDLALFLSPAMQYLYRGAPLSKPEEEGFLAAYPDPHMVGRYLALKPWFHWRMAAYCLWRSQRGEPRDQVALSLECAALDQSIMPKRA